MVIRRWILSFLLAAMIAVLAGCSSTNTFSPQNPPPPPAPTISIQYSPPLAGPLQIPINATTNLTAVVTNDPSDAGVDWSLTCQNAGNCGTLNETHTASGSPVTYTPPASLSSNTLNVLVVAYATANHAYNALAQVDVTAFGTNFPAGNYVLEAQGVDSNGGPNYQFAGVIALDGNGNITSGEQTVNFFDTSLATPGLVSKTDPITKGSYFVGPDGRGTITINTADTDIGGNGTETFTLVYLNSSQALIAQNDTVGATTGATATGTMDLQNSAAITAAPAGSYALVLSGLQTTLPPTSTLTPPQPVALGGILNIDSLNSPNTISGNFSTMDDVLPNASGVGLPSIVNAKLPSGSVTTPDAYGQVTFNLKVPFLYSSPSIIQFTGYIVDATHIKLIESDNSNPAIPGFGSTAGVAIAQASNPGGPGNLSVASMAGQYVFGATGTDLDSSPLAPNTLTAAGMFYADGAGNLSNDSGTPADGDFMDVVLQANNYLGSNGLCNVNGTPPIGAQVSLTFGGTYIIDTAGIGSIDGSGGEGVGRIGTSLNAFNPQPLCGGFTSHFILYLTGDVTVGNCPTANNGNCPALVIALGNSFYPFIGTGIAYPQAANPTFPPTNSGLSFTQYSSSGENDGTGQMTAEVSPPSFSGTADNSVIGVDLGFDGTYDPGGCFVMVGVNLVAVPNCFPGTLSSSTGAFQIATNLNQISAHFYAIDGSLGNPGGFFIETDWLQQMEAAPGTAPLVSFGYFAAQCPVNSGTTCPPPAQQADRSGRVVRK